MKKAVYIICLVLVIAFLTGCTTIQFVAQENISFNYNNLSAGDSYYWVDNDAVFYLDYLDHLDQDSTYVMKTEDTTVTLSQTSEYDYSYIYRTGDTVFYGVRLDDETTFHEVQPLYDIYQYDIPSQTESFITQVNSLNSFFTDDTYLYVLLQQEYFNQTLYVAQIYQLETGALIDTVEKVYTAGMRNNIFTYLQTTDNGFVIHQWNTQTQTSEQIATMELPNIEDYTIYFEVNFTTKVMILQGYHSEIFQNLVLIYNFETQTLNTLEIAETVEDLIAFENNAFYTVCSVENDYYELYSLSLPRGESTYLGKINSDKSLFVTSDKDVYLCSNWEEEIVHYNLDGTKEGVLMEVNIQQ